MLGDDPSSGEASSFAGLGKRVSNLAQHAFKSGGPTSYQQRVVLEVLQAIFRAGHSGAGPVWTPNQYGSSRKLDEGIVGSGPVERLGDAGSDQESEDTGEDDIGFVARGRFNRFPSLASPGEQSWRTGSVVLLACG